MFSCLYGAGEGQWNNSAGRGIESLAYATENERTGEEGGKLWRKKERKGHYLFCLHILRQVHTAFIQEKCVPDM